MAYRYIPPYQVLNQTVSGTNPIQSTSLIIRTLPISIFVIAWGAGLNATFQALVSVDGVNFDDLGIPITPATGAAGRTLVNLGALGGDQVLIQVTPSSGSANVTITGSAKSGGA